MQVGDRIKFFRKKRKFSQYNLSRVSGVSQSYLSALEANEKSPTVNTLKKICRALGICLAEFFSEETTAQVPTFLQPLLEEARYLTDNQCEILAQFLSEIRKAKN